MSLNQAISAWREILGKENVLTDSNSLAGAETATFSTSQKIPVILRPKDNVEVKACLAIANEFGTSIYSISRGCNWGLGSSVPVESGSALLDLSRLNKITDYDEKKAYVTIQPGVTLRQLYQFLRQQESNLMVALTGSTPDSSIVGNVMERGHAKGPYADRFSYVCGLEVILPTGEVVRTGFKRFSGAKAGSVSRWGVGPWLEGLFSQSNLGIVTEMTLWLMPYPEVFQTCYFSIDGDQDLPALIDELRVLKLSSSIRSSISMLNDFRVQSELSQYPWDLTHGKTPLSREELSKMTTRNQRMPIWTGQWNGEFGLYSMSEAQALTDRSVIERQLRSRVTRIEWLQESGASLRNLIRQTPDTSGLNYAQARMLSFLGIPFRGSIPITYWRKKSPIPVNMNPDRDGCGIIWCSPTVPFDGKDVFASTRIIQEVFEHHGFEPNICLNCVSDRSIDITAAILFDRSITGEDEKAARCYQEMVSRVTAEGYIPYRLTVNSMLALESGSDDSQDVLDRIKRVLDPNGVLSPGRYELDPKSQAAPLSASRMQLARA